MSNPLIGMMAKHAVGNMPQTQMIQQFMQFRKGWTPESAQQQINQLLQSGRINQQQLEQAKAMAQQMQGLFK